MEPMNILIPAYDFKPLLGGVANYGHELAVQFSKQARVHVLSRELDGMEEFDQNLPYRISRIRAPHSGLLSFPLFARAVRAMVRREPPEAIFCPMWFPDGAACRWAVRGTSIPYYVAAHGTEVFDNLTDAKNTLRTLLTHRLKKQVFREAAKVFPVSRYTRQAVLQEGGGDGERVVTVHNGVNGSVFRKIEVAAEVRARYQQPGEKILLTVTRLHPYKGVDRMLEALPSILRSVPRVKYLVVGEGPDLPRLRALAARLGLEGRVRFLGRLPISEIVALYNLADLFVLLSREEPPDVEGFGLVFLEAAACGLPSVGGRSGGIPDAVEEGRSGWLVDPSNTDEIAATIADRLRSPGKLQSAAEYCLSAAPEASWDRVAEKILQEMLG
jgi:phosphatidylinositol alpha-1,6-mannosyltransferase